MNSDKVNAETSFSATPKLAWPKPHVADVEVDETGNNSANPGDDGLGAGS